MEIERKFLVDRLPGKPPAEVWLIRQGYIADDPVLRVRRRDDLCFFTYKDGGGMVHEEYEREITPEQFDKLWPLVRFTPIEKKRSLYPLAEGLTAELDKYSGDLAGLMTVEVEFASEEAANAFHPPDWFGREITQDRRYSNAALSKYGMPDLF